MIKCQINHPNRNVEFPVDPGVSNWICIATAAQDRYGQHPRIYQILMIGFKREINVKPISLPEVPRLTGKPIMRIICKKTGRVVGYLYQWNNGDLQPAWLNEAMAEVRYEPMVNAA